MCDVTKHRSRTRFKHSPRLECGSKMLLYYQIVRYFRLLRQPHCHLTSKYLFVVLLLCCIIGNAGAIENSTASTNRFKRYSIKATVEERIETATETPSGIRPDTVCNEGGVHECVCNRSLGNLDDRLLLCDQFLEVRHLKVVSLVIREINFDVRLHTNEPYQQYFRRRIANIVSTYCEHQANECPGAVLSLNKENVVVLRVNYLSRKRTQIQLVVTKEPNAERLNDATMLDSNKVKHVLGAQLAPLSRVLGGVKIEKLRLEEIDRRKVAGQNNRLIKMMAIIGCGLAFCYLIAIIKICRDCMKKRRAKKNDAILAERNNNNNRNYGSCTDKLLSSCEAPNGKVKSKSIISRTTANSSSKSRRTSSEKRSKKSDNNEDLTSITIDRPDISQPEISPASGTTDTHSFQRMFACDLSQLPAESCDLMDGEDQDAVFLDESEALDVTQPPSKKVSKVNQVENAEIHNDSAEATPNSNASPSRRPEVPIIISSGSQFSIDKEPKEESKRFEVPTVNVRPEYTHQDSTDSLPINQFVHTKSLLGAIDEGVSFDRPLSRRGSRDSTPEQGGEEFADDVSSDTPQPLGDTTLGNPKTVLIVPSRRKKKRAEESSSESEDDEPNEVYHALNEDDEDTAENKLKVAYSMPQTPFKESHDSSDSEVEQNEEHLMLDRHAYEPLEESPLASPSIFTNNNNSIGKELFVKRPEDVISGLAERIPSEEEEEDLR